MEKSNKDNIQIIQAADAEAAESPDNAAPGAENMSAGALAADITKKRFGAIHVTVICLSLICVLLIGLLGWQITRMNKVYSFIGENTGTDLSNWTATGAMQGNHPLYDDSAVVKAYKSGDDTGLSDKDAYVLKAAKSVIDEVITDGMTDYEKELAIYDWQFGYTHYNDSAFAPIGSNNPGESGEDSSQPLGDSASESSSAAYNADTGEEILVDTPSQTATTASVTTDASSGNMSLVADQAAKDDPICEEDPYKENYDYEPYGVLKYGSYICVGNATTFKLFMDMLDIPCQIIHSTGEGEHAWDLVQIDGDWYHVDLTFDGGSKLPTYSAFNVPDDAKLNAGYPWDTTEFPAADSTKYCYAVKNAVEVSDIYELPSMVHTALTEGKGSLPVKFASNITITEDDLFVILDQMASYSSDAYFYASKVDYITDKQIYMLQFDIYTEETGDEDNSSDEPRYDQDKMTQAIEYCFGTAQG